jgi:hypothetical protein
MRIQDLQSWIVFCIKRLWHYWSKDRMFFLLCLSIAFICILWIYNRYFCEEETVDTKQQKQKQLQTLDDIVKIRYKRLLKRKRIQKKHEHRCREILENIYLQPFPTIRPDFLKFPKTNKNLELDMYNDQLKLAVEYDGCHHRKYTKFFHKSFQDFLDQQERDKYKDQRCQELGITLIRIPDTIKYDNLEQYIKTKLSELNLY